MGGIRTAGDLVLRMQLARSMRIDEAKQFLAQKFRCSLEDLSDTSVMQEIRQDLDIGYPMPPDGAAKGIEAKFRISEYLGIKINSVERFKKKVSWK
jgi:hypothetical protein